jgi:16S rRNA (uracil1498-N3)-methyltransferase
MSSSFMRRFFIEDIIEENGMCLIPEKEARHMTKVLRMKAGDSFTLINGKGEGFEAVIETASHKEVYARIIKELSLAPSSPVNIDICQAILKPRMMDYMIEKTSELGVNQIQPFYSERTVIKPDKDTASNKIRHWRMIAQSALKQCGRAIPAEINDPINFKEMVKAVADKGGVKVVLWEGEERSDLKTLLKEKETAADFTGIIGPEGGFTGQEINLMRDAGIIPVSVGSRILRAETAAIALTTIIQYEWGDLGI